MSISKTYLFFVGACAATVALPALAWDWDIRDPLQATSDLHPGSLAADAGGFWLSMGSQSLVRYDGAGQRVFSKPYGEPYYYVDDGFAIESDGSGGFIAANRNIQPSVLGGMPPVPCALSHYGADGLLRWRNELDLGRACDHVERDGEGNLWVTMGDWSLALQSMTRATRLTILDSRGVNLANADLLERGLPIRELRANPKGSGAYVYDGNGVTALDASLTTRWQHRGDGQGKGRIAIDTTGTLWLAEAGTSNGSLHVARYDADGVAKIDLHLTPTPAIQEVLALATTADGGVYELDRAADAVGTSPLTLRHYSAAGALRWSTALGADVDACATDYGRCALVTTTKGNAVLAVHQPATGQATTRIQLRHYGADGQRRGSVDAPASHLDGLAALSDGASVALVRADAYNLIDITAQALHLDAEGNAAPPPATAGVVKLPEPFVASLAASDGETYLLTQMQEVEEYFEVNMPDRAGRYTLSRIGADGTVRWRVQNDGLWFSSGTTLAADASRVCIGGLGSDSTHGDTHLRVTCHERADGALAWTRNTDAGGQRQGEMRIALTPDHGISALAKAGSLSMAGLRHQGYSVDGSLLHDTPLVGAPDNAYVWAFNAIGDAVAMQDVLVSVRADGSQRYAIAAPVRGAALDLSEDGSVVAIGFDAGAELWSVAPNGTQRWLRTLTTTPAYYAHLQRRANGRLDLSVAPNSQYDTHLFVARANLGDGSLLWQRLLPMHDDDRLIPGADSRQVLLGFNENARVGLRLLDGDDGHDVSLRREPCGGLCRFSSASVSDTGVLHGVLSDIDAWGAPTHAVGLAHATQTPSPARVDQHALGGAWWAPYSGGQGFMLDVLPDTKTFFMPWFTFTPDGRNDPKDQRWYTIQGALPTGATELTLGIYDSRGGTFDLPQAPTPSRVGTATLRFGDCDHGQLHFRFDAPANDGREGDITLSRLLPRNETCTLADGTQAPASVTAAPHGGFDSRMSGSWYEPANGGQGLQLSVQPDGPVFAAWFTYDPAGHADDETAQHWLTLQGDLRTAHDGVGTAVIAEAIGGQLDGPPAPNQYRLGQAVLTALACDHLRVDYVFDDAPSAGAFRKKAGSLDLVRIGGCRP